MGPCLIKKRNLGLKAEEMYWESPELNPLETLEGVEQAAHPCEGGQVKSSRLIGRAEVQLMKHGFTFVCHTQTFTTWSFAIINVKLESSDLLFVVSPQLMFSSIVVRPVDHADGSGVVKPRHAVVALRESQWDGYNPNESNHNLGGGGGETWLQWVDDGHVSVEEEEVRLSWRNSRWTLLIKVRIVNGVKVMEAQSRAVGNKTSSHPIMKLCRLNVQKFKLRSLKSL